MFRILITQELVLLLFASLTLPTKGNEEIISTIPVINEDCLVKREAPDTVHFESDGIGEGSDISFDYDIVHDGGGNVKRANTFKSEFKRLPFFNFGLGKRSDMTQNEPDHMYYESENQDDELRQDYVDIRSDSLDGEEYDESGEQSPLNEFVLGKPSNIDPDRDIYNNAVDTEDLMKAKRTANYLFGLGKKAHSFGFGLGKRDSNYKFGFDKSDPNYRFGIGRRDSSYRFGIGKRDSDFSFGLKKAVPLYNFGFGKRDQNLKFGLGKRYQFGLGKRAPDFSFGVGKRSPNFKFGLGKKSSSFNVGVGKRLTGFRFGLGKRAAYGFGVGKRAPGFKFGLGKRLTQYRFGVGKRSSAESGNYFHPDKILRDHEINYVGGL